MATGFTPQGYTGTITKAGVGSNLPFNAGGSFDAAQMGSAMTAGMDALGQFSQYQGMATAGDLNASLLDITADGVIVSGDFQAKRLREQGNRFAATQIARYAKSGVTFEGSPAYALIATERNISLDVINTKLNAANKANQIGFQALQQRMAAGQARTRSIQALGQGVLKMGSMFMGAT
jgi:hypothetical protein